MPKGVEVIMSASAQHSKEPEFPRVGDSFFDENAPGRYAFLKYPAKLPEEDWPRYVEGYRLAAEAVASLVPENPLKVDYLVFPVVYLYRQHFELALKALIVVGSKQSGMACDAPADYNHDLCRMWQDARKILEWRYRNADPEPIHACEKLLHELAGLDPGSFSFRYPETKSGDTTHPNVEKLNLVHFAQVASRLSDFLACCLEGLVCSSDHGE